MNTRPDRPTPWIDLHGHAGRCFLAGSDDRDPLAGLLGEQRVATALAEAQRAGLAAISLATVSDLRVLEPDPDAGLRASRQFRGGEALADHDRQLQGLRRLLASAGAEVAVSAAAIEIAHAAGRTAVLLGCEGGDFLDESLEPLARARAAGVSALTLLHYRVSQIGDVQTAEPVHGGLTAVGRAVVAECNRLGMIVDCAHASFATTMDVLAVSRDPIMISHSHLDRRPHHPRLLSAEHARAVASAGGLIGAWPSGVTSTSLGDFADEVVRLVEVVGVEHVAVGTDMDGNYRPVLVSYAEFATLPQMLTERGLSEEECDSILGGNALALFRTVVG